MSLSSQRVLNILPRSFYRIQTVCVLSQSGWLVTELHSFVALWLYSLHLLESKCPPLWSGDNAAKSTRWMRWLNEILISSIEHLICIPLAEGWETNLYGTLSFCKFYAKPKLLLVLDYLFKDVCITNSSVRRKQCCTSEQRGTGLLSLQMSQVRSYGTHIVWPSAQALWEELELGESTQENVDALATTFAGNNEIT